MKVRINGIDYPAELLTTPEEIEKGLAGRESLDGCVIFQMGTGLHTFWMKGCIIPLDIVFVYNRKISRIHKNCQPCDGECVERYSGMGDNVIEFPANSTDDFKVGDLVKIIAD